MYNLRFKIFTWENTIIIKLFKKYMKQRRKLRKRNVVEWEMYWMYLKKIENLEEQTKKKSNARVRYGSTYYIFVVIFFTIFLL